MPVLKRDRKPDLGIKSVEDKVAAGSWEMSRLNPKDNHKGPSHPALLEILKTATKKRPGYIFISPAAHDWNEPTKLWRRQGSVA